jgi:hypothetical protein
LSLLTFTGRPREPNPTTSLLAFLSSSLLSSTTNTRDGVRSTSEPFPRLPPRRPRRSAGSSHREPASLPHLSRSSRSLSPSLQPIPGSAKPGSSAIYVNSQFPTWAPGRPYPKTTFDCFNLGLTHHPKNPCLGKREWDTTTGDWAKTITYETYEQIDGHRTRVGSGLVKLKQELFPEENEAQWKVRFSRFSHSVPEAS